jgi:hypothetical protein
MPLSHRENYLRTASFSRGTPPPEHIPISAVISGASWDQLRGDLEDVLVRHPLFFPGFRKGQHDYSKRAFGTARDIHDLIEEEVRKLGSPRGGLMMIVGIYPPTPAANVHALLTAFEKHRTHWWS